MKQATQRATQRTIRGAIKGARGLHFFLLIPLSLLLGCSSAEKCMRDGKEVSVVGHNDDQLKQRCEAEGGKWEKPAAGSGGGW